MIGPWGPLGQGGLNFYIEVNGEILRNPYLGNAWGDRHQIRSILRFWGRSVEEGSSDGKLNIFWGEGTHFRE